MSAAAAAPARWRWFAGGILLAGLGFGLAGWMRERARNSAEARRAEHEREVAEQAQPVAGALANAAAVEEPYDIEKTMRVVRELDLAVERVGSMREYFDVLAHQDYRRVAPKVLETRKRILEVLAKYWAAAERQRHEEELWQSFERWSEALTDLFASFRVRADTGIGSFSFASDPEMQKQLAAERKEREASRKDSFADMQQFESELLLALDAAVPVLRDIEDEWARLCLQRDRAYLEAFDGHYAQARISAQAALAMAPYDQEAQLLIALASIEGEDPLAPASNERLGDVRAALDRFLHEHPDSAPALLMRGLWNVRHGNVVDGRTDLELAMTRYPEQADSLRDVLDPYRDREYLAKTRQGVRITGMYRSMMLGACWFSPELQIARLDFQEGDQAAAFARIRDHFARRRAQGQWDLIVYDIGFCDGLLGEPYRSYFPERSYLDLQVEHDTFGSGVSIVVRNRSDVALHNATLVLCVRFTDMHPDDQVTFAIGKTKPLVPALESTTFGSLEIEYELGGVKKDIDDVVPPFRALLVSDEAVAWIDTIEFKDERASRAAPPGSVPAPPSTPATLSQRLRDVLAGITPENVRLERVKNLLTPDDLRIELPREIVLLGPLFRLVAGEQVFDEAKSSRVENRIEDGRVRLSFASVGKALDGSPEELRLIARSALGDVVLVLRRNAAGNYVFERVEGP